MRYLFEDYVLDPERRELTRGGEAIAVGPQVFDVLVYLLQHRARVAAKDDLLDVVWGGRIVSESTLTSHINAARKAIGDNGHDQRLIRTIARKGFRFVGLVTEAPSAPEPASVGAPAVIAEDAPGPALALPEKPSIAVLPFLNLSGQPDQEYFVDGVVEDILSALSRIGWLFVIARNSSFTYKGRAVDVRQVGRDLGVRYVLEGSVRRSASRVRITGQLVDATSGGQIWAERFESTLDDIFDLQEQVAADVVGAIAPQLERAEIERAKRKPTASLDAYDYYLRGMAHLHDGTREAIDEALALFLRAIDLGPDFAAAYAMAAWCHFWRKFNGSTADRATETMEGARLARRAVALGHNDAVALARSGHVIAHLVGDFDSAIALIDRARMLDPNHAPAWFLGGFVRLWHNQPDEAIEHFTHAMRLSPLDPETYRIQAGTAMGHLLAGRFDEAAAWAQRALRELPSFLIALGVLAASHALAGRSDAARRAMADLRALDPALRTSNLADWLPLHSPQVRAIFEQGLRSAGLPQ